MIKNLSAVSTPIQPPVSSILTSPSTPLKASKSPSVTQVTETQSNSSLLRITPRKLEAVALLISSISELIGQISKVIRDYQNRETSQGAASQPSPSVPPKAPASPLPVTPKPTPSVDVPTTTMTSTSAINTLTTAPQENSVTSALNQVLGKLTDLELLLTSIFGMSESPLVGEQTAVNKTATKTTAKAEKSFFGNLLSSAGKFALDLIPGKEILSGVGSLVKSGNGFVKSIFSSLFA